jgi:hypothetical protein
MSKYKTIFYTTILSFLVSFIGGYSSLVFCSYFADFRNKINATDAISMANTYIVFTTIIFVGVSLVLVIAGFIFTHQFSTAKENSMHHLFDELESLLKENKSDYGIKFIESCLKNSDVREHLNKKLLEKIDTLQPTKSTSASNGSSLNDLLKLLNQKK